MQIFNLPTKNKHVILALGAESAGNFSVYIPRSPFAKRGMGGFLYFSEDFGDLLIDVNFKKFERKLNKFLRENKIKPDIILTDLHPLYKTTLLGQELAKKFKAKHIQIQHHLAHIFSCIGENMINSKALKALPAGRQVKAESYGIALDGTGYGLDNNIWGGEVFEISNFSKAKLLKFPKLSFRKISRIGKLENQLMIGGDLAVKEPARVLIAILAKFPISNFQFPNKSKAQNSKLQKAFIYQYVKKFYTRNQFEVLYNQLRDGFNCQETSSTGRILDAVSVLLGFSKNERNYKHEPAILLEKNSTIPYTDLKPLITKNPPLPPFFKGGILSPFLKGRVGERFLYELNTVSLFKYLIKNINKDKHRLAATAQLYIAEGLYRIVKKCHPEFISGSKKRIPGQARNDIFLAGGIANNKIISDYFISKDAIVNNAIPRGDAGISFGQIIYFLFQTQKYPASQVNGR